MSLLENETTSVYPASTSTTAATRAKAYRLRMPKRGELPATFTLLLRLGGRELRAESLPAGFAEKISGLALLTDVRCRATLPRWWLAAQVPLVCL